MRGTIYGVLPAPGVRTDVRKKRACLIRAATCSPEVTVTAHINGSAERDSSHPRTIGWFETTALATAGNSGVVLIIASLIVNQGTAAIPLLVAGMLLALAALPGWTELVLLRPNDVGGLGAGYFEAFYRYSPMLAALAGCGYWTTWALSCEIGAAIFGSTIHQWFLPWIPVNAIAIVAICLLAVVALCGTRRAARLAIPVALGAGALALLSAVVPLLSGHVHWHRALAFTLVTPFDGWFGKMTSIMAGFYIIGYVTPAFEGAAAFVGQTKNPTLNVPRAMRASAAIATAVCVFLPIVWLGNAGSGAFGADLTKVLGPAFAPLLGPLAGAAATSLLTLVAIALVLQPLAGASQTLAQLSVDGLAPRYLGRRLRNDAPWAAIAATAAAAIGFLLIGNPLWILAATNFSYLFAISLASVAVWLLRRDAPQRRRLYRAPRGTLTLGLCAAAVWMLSAVLGFEQFGSATIVAGIAFSCAGAPLYLWRLFEDRRRAGLRGMPHSLHVSVTVVILLVLATDSAFYLVAVRAAANDAPAITAALEDIFTLTALSAMAAGLILPGKVAFMASELNAAARGLTHGTIKQFELAMADFARGDLDAIPVEAVLDPLVVRSRDELGQMASSFNDLQAAVGRSVIDARDGLRRSREDLLDRNLALGETNAALATEVGERKRVEERLLHVAFHDHLTGLPNRALFFERLDRLVAKNPEKERIFAVMFVDLDRFKSVNDDLGHRIGDALLVAVARRIEGCLRSGDLVARIGGDEFTTLIDGISDEKAAASFAERMIRRLTEPFDIEGKEVFASASVGYVVGRAGSGDSEDILRKADLAMYRAKELGKGRSEPFVPELLERASGRARLETDVRLALERNEFQLFYQPIVELAGGRITGFEALIRWKHPVRGMLGAVELIESAESTGIIVPIGRWVLREACRQLRVWHDAHPMCLPLSMSVNVSGKQFAYAGLAQHIADALRESQLGASDLHIELTESSVMENMNTASATLARLHAMGVKIHLDDFGTGFTSLSYLDRFPIDALKIDRTFVSSTDGAIGSGKIVRNIVELAKSFDMTTIAEGIETERQLTELRDIGCTKGQGYHLSRPLNAQAASQLLSPLVSLRSERGAEP